MSDILRRAQLVNRQVFDPTNPLHIESFECFLKTGNWGDIQFWPEVPYTEAPMTVMMKFARHALGITPETATERSERIRANTKLVQYAAEEPSKERLARANVLLKQQLTSVKPAA